MRGQIIPQGAGQAIHVPSEAVHQVHNLRNHVKVVYDYLLPDRLHKYMRSHRKVHRRMFCLDASWPEDYMQVSEIITTHLRKKAELCPAFQATYHGH